MKKIHLAVNIFIISLSLNCTAQKKALNVYEIIYDARSRGSFETISVKNNDVFYKNIKESKTILLKKEEKITLEKLVSKIKLKEISNLESPTNKRSYDGAMRAKISITIGKETYTSSTFDHGHPPKELKPLISMLRAFLE